MARQNKNGLILLQTDFSDREKLLKFEAEGREFAKSAGKVRKTKIKEIYFYFFYSNNKENHQSDDDDDDEVQEVSS